MNTKLDNKIKLLLVYVTIALMLFSAIYYFVNNLNTNETTVTIKMRQSQTQNVWVHYEYQTYNDKDYSVNQIINASETFETYKFSIPEKYISNIDVQFTASGNEPNFIEIKEITISSLFTKKHIKQFENYSFYIDNQDERCNLIDGVVFSDFELTTKLKIISLIFAIIITILARRLIAKIFLDTEFSKQRFKVTIFTFGLTAVYVTMFISIDEEISNLLSGRLTQKPTIKSYSEIFDKSFMNSYEKYKKNQYVYRDFLIEDYYAFNRLLQRNYYGGIYMTESNTDNTDTVVYSTTYNEENLNSSIDNITLLNEYLTYNNVPYYYFLAPDSTVFNLDLYPDYLNNDSVKMYNYTINQLEQNGVDTYNLYEFMSENLVGKYDRLYYRLDNHWTTETALSTYDYIVNTIRNDGVDVASSPVFNTDTYEDMFVGFYGAKLAYGYRYNQLKDNYTAVYPQSDYNYTVKNVFSDNSFDGNYYSIGSLHNINKKPKYLHLYNYTVGNATNNIIINNDIDNDKTVVVIGDSFSKPVALFLTQNFKRVIALDNRQVESGKAYEFIRDNIDNIDAVVGLNAISSNNETVSCFEYFGDHAVITSNYNIGDQITNTNASFENFYDYNEWSNGDGKITININEVDENAKYNLISDITTYYSVDKMEIFINDVLVDSLEEPELSQRTTLNLEIEKGLLQTGENEIYFKVHGADSPKNRGESDDPRILGFRINKTKIVEIE